MTARLLVALALTSGCRATGDPLPEDETEERRPRELVASWGLSEILRDDPVGTFRVEYRHRPLIADLVPVVGFSLLDGPDASYAYLGAHYPFDLTRRLRLSPTFAVGYFDPGGGLDLGGELEFRSGIELSWLLHERFRLGMEFAHISNANLFPSNPGTETLSLGLHVLF